MTTDWTPRLHPELVASAHKAPRVTFGPVSTRLLRLVYKLTPNPREASVVRMASGPMLWFAPEEGVRARGALLWLHGGGRVFGAPKTEAWLCAHLAKTLGLHVFAPTYRLATQHPFPAAHEDAHAAWHWIQENAARLGLDPWRVAIGGESAGGGLAAELTQRLLDEDGVQPCAQLLLCAMLDDRTATDDALTAERHLVWNNRSNHYAWSSYLSGPPGRAAVPRYSVAARRQDLSGLPPAWIHVGSLDLFAQENLTYWQRLQGAGVPVEIEHLVGAYHGYYTLGGSEALTQAMLESMGRFLGRCMRLEGKGAPGFTQHVA